MSRVCSAVVAQAAAAAAVVCCAACRPSGDRPSSAAAAATSAPAAPAAAPAAGGTSEDLTFTGAVSGRMTSGRKGGVYFCGKLGPRFVADPIQGDVGGAPFDFSITIAEGYKGPGTYRSAKELTPGSGYAAVTVGLAHAGSGTKEWVNGTGANVVVVNADERSGTVTAELHATGSAPGTVHVSGTWRCPPD